MSMKFENIGDFTFLLIKKYGAVYQRDVFPYKMYRLGEHIFYIGLFGNSINIYFKTEFLSLIVPLNIWIEVKSWKHFEEMFDLNVSPIYSREIELTLIGKNK